MHITELIATPPLPTLSLCRLGSLSLTMPTIAALVVLLFALASSAGLGHASAGIVSTQIPVGVLGSGANSTGILPRRLAGRASGDLCSSSGACASGLCRGRCCADGVSGDTCLTCTWPRGECSLCIDGYFEAGGFCFRQGVLEDEPIGHGCVRGTQCASGLCHDLCCSSDDPVVSAGSCGQCNRQGECTACGVGCDVCNQTGTKSFSCSECALAFTLKDGACVPFVDGSTSVMITFIVAVVVACLLLGAQCLGVAPPRGSESATGVCARARHLFSALGWAGSFEAGILIVQTALSALDVLSDVAAFVDMCTRDQLGTAFASGFLLVLAAFGTFVLPMALDGWYAENAKSQGKPAHTSSEKQPQSIAVLPASAEAKSGSDDGQPPAAPSLEELPSDDGTPRGPQADGGQDGCAVVGAAASGDESAAARPGTGASQETAAEAAVGQQRSRCPCYTPRCCKAATMLFVQCFCCGICVAYVVVMIVLMFNGTVYGDFYFIFVPPLFLIICLSLLRPAAEKAAAFGKVLARPNLPQSEDESTTTKLWVTLLPITNSNRVAVAEAFCESLPQGMLQVAILATMSTAALEPGAGATLEVTPVTLALALSLIKLASTLRIFVFIPGSVVLFLGCALLAAGDGVLWLHSVATLWPVVVEPMLVPVATPFSLAPWLYQALCIRVLVVALVPSIVYAAIKLRPQCRRKGTCSCSDVAGLCAQATCQVLYALMITYLVMPWVWLASYMCWTLVAVQVSAAFASTKYNHLTLLAPLQAKLSPVFRHGGHRGWRRAVLPAITVLQVGTISLVPWLTWGTNKAEPVLAPLFAATYSAFICAGIVLVLAGVALESRAAKETAPLQQKPSTV